MLLVKLIIPLVLEDREAHTPIFHENLNPFKQNPRSCCLLTEWESATWLEMKLAWKNHNQYNSEGRIRCVGASKVSWTSVSNGRGVVKDREDRRWVVGG